MNLQHEIRLLREAPSGPSSKAKFSVPLTLKVHANAQAGNQSPAP
jgi:hypothetical protein